MGAGGCTVRGNGFPLGIIEQVIPLLLDGSIIHYRYDPESMTLEKRAGDGKGR